MTPGSDDTPEFAHEPVMAAEVVEILSEVPPGVVVDATVGGGGHARAVLEERPDVELLGLDRDEVAVDAARRHLAAFGGRVRVVHSRFERLGEVVREQMEARAGTDGSMGEGSMDVVGVLFDLGVSSPQLDDPARGFSFRADAPIDMRMDRSQGPTAADLVNDLPERDLARLIRRYGEERFARPIARQIVASRPLRTTGELADAVVAGIPARARRTGRHPARRTFQALRMAVNDELANLEAGLDAALAVVAPRGRIAVLAYHSLEDRIVKRRFQDWATGGVHPPGLPVPETQRGGVVRVLTPRPRRPSPEEVARNRRAESVRLRAVERLEEAA